MLSLNHGNLVLVNEGLCTICHEGHWQDIYIYKLDRQLDKRNFF